MKMNVVHKFKERIKNYYLEKKSFMSLPETVLVLSLLLLSLLLFLTLVKH